MSQHLNEPRQSSEARSRLVLAALHLADQSPVGGSIECLHVGLPKLA